MGSKCLWGLSVAKSRKEAAQSPKPAEWGKTAVKPAKMLEQAELFASESA